MKEKNYSVYTNVGHNFFGTMSSRILSLTFVILTLITIKSFAQKADKSSASKDKIQIALLLDVSGSMDHLILKTKSQFWRIANYLNNGTKKGKAVDVQFALITYGGIFGTFDSQTSINSYLTSDLDSISDQLYQIEVGGGDEYCWAAINIALEELTWTKRKGDLRIILIAGNESFNQGEIGSEVVIEKANKLDVIINTIYCNEIEDSISREWRDSAILGGGSYFTLSLTDSLDLTENFLDKKLIEFNDKLNETYIPFGQDGDYRFNRMLMQDKNSRLTGMPFFRERIAYKAKDSFFNPTWDLVDAFQKDSIWALSKEARNELSEEYKLHSQVEIKNMIEINWHKRQSYREAIRLRHEMITRSLDNKIDMNAIDAPIREIVNKEGKKKGFVFKPNGS